MCLGAEVWKPSAARRVLDLRKYTFKTEIFMHLQKEFDQSAKEGRPPQPNISVSGSDSVEVIHFPGYGYDYAVIETITITDIDMVLVGLCLLRPLENVYTGGNQRWKSYLEGTKLPSKFFKKQSVS